ncbi:MAG: serine/threonine-protein kinase [Pseudomonadota bacterium]
MSLQRRALTLFGELAGLDAAERAARLDALATGEPALHRELLALLRADARVGVLERDAASVLATPPEGASADRERMIGRQLGAWRITGLLGSGGMGTVYAAERSDGGFEQHAAVKLIRIGLDRPELRERFRRERRILAQLQHPHIATLLDGGIGEDGAPYLAMERIDGAPIDRWCDTRSLDLHARVRLFRQVCAAVGHAHRNLVVHRDLKPANVLVTPDGVAKLMDFGIAKLLDETGDGLTRTRERVFTPEYAAPEQLHDGPITTATDVYALGALLYTLLAGTPPCGDARRLQPLALLGRDPEPLPRAALRLDPARLQARGHLRAQTLARALRGDLDAIVQRCLQREPAARYASVASLDADLQAWLDGLPVSASRGRRLYRAGKFVRRHRAGVAAAAAAFVALAAGLSLALWQAQRAGAAAQQAQREAERARQVERFLAGLFEAADPAQSRGEDATARELLERGAQRVDTELAGQPLAQAEMLEVLGRVYQRLGRFDRAAELLERATTRLRDAGAEPLRLARALHLAGEAQSDNGRYAEAGERLREAAALRRRHLGAAHPETADTLAVLGTNLHLAGRLDEAAAALEQARAIHEASLDRTDPRRLTVMTYLADLALDRGEAGKAVAIHREVLDTVLDLHGELYPDAATGMTNLGWALGADGRLAEARQMLERAITVRTRILDRNDPNLATSWHHLGVTLRSLGEYAQAEQAFAQVLRIDRAALHAQHPWIAFALDNLASVLIEQDRTAEALRLLDEATPLLAAIYGEDSLRAATHQQIRAAALARAGDIDGAAALLDRVLSLRRARPEAQPAALAAALVARARLLAQAGAADAAEAMLREALARQRAVLPAAHIDIATTLVALAETQLALTKVDAADAALREALRIRVAALPADNWQILQVQALRTVGACQRGDAGGSALAAALARLGVQPGDRHPATQSIRELAAYCDDSRPTALQPEVASS